MDSTKCLVYSGKLQPLEIGHIVSIKGKTKDEAENIEFLLGSLDTESVNFRLAVRFAEPAILRNSFSEETGWSKEETDENMLPNNKLNPIKPGNDFKVSIYAESEMFYVTIDEKPHCVYPYNGNVEDIQRLKIFGDVEAIYEIDHSIANPEMKRNGESFTTTIPSFDENVATVFTGTARGSPEGRIVIYLCEHNSTKRVLMKMVASFIDKTVIVTSGNEITG